jgi:hypothetical protein
MPTVIVDGAAYHFAPSHGRMLLGQVKLERRAVLLAAIDDMLAVIHVAGRATVRVARRQAAQLP